MKALIVKREWWRDPELNLAQCAKNLGTNTSHLSRAINDGLHQNFNALINGLRVVAGFSSKASFNRSFKTIVGSTPTAFRDAAQLKKIQHAGSSD